MSRRYAGLAGTCLVVAAWAGVLVGTGSSWSTLAWWAGVLAVGVLLPGVALVRAVRSTTVALVEDVAWGAAAGCVVCLAGWFVDRVLPWSPGPFVWGPVVAAATLVGAGSRRRVLARPAPGWGVGPALAMTASMLVALAWMTTSALGFQPPDPGARGVVYSVDSVYQLALLGELRHTLVPTYPLVSGEPLSYHWFIYAIQAHLSAHVPIDLFDLTLRLFPSALVLAILLLAAVVARRLAGMVAAGPIAAVLIAAVGNSTGNAWSGDGGSLSILRHYWQNSPPQTLGWLAGLALLGTMVAVIRDGPDDRAVPRWLLVPFLVLTVGAKSSELPVLLCGVGLALLVAAVRRQRRQAARALGMAGLGAVAFLLATRTIYAGGSYGIMLRPLQRAEYVASTMFPGLGHREGPLHLANLSLPWAAVLIGLVVFFVPLAPRLVGYVWLVRSRADDPGTWVTAGTGIGGLLATYAFRHPALSEIYFLVSAYPIALVGSACGLAVGLGPVARRLRAGHGRIAGAVVGLAAVLGVGGALVVAAVAGPTSPAVEYAATRHLPGATDFFRLVQRVWPWLEPVAALTVLVLVAGVVLRLVTAGLASRDQPGTLASGGASVGASGRGALASRGVTGLVPLALVVTLLGTGAASLGQNIERGFVAMAQPGPAPRGTVTAGGVPRVTTSVIAAGSYIDAHAGAQDVVATNRQCTTTLPFRSRTHTGCDARAFDGSAFSQRRVDVGGWAYAPRVISSAWSSTQYYAVLPFWDPARLSQELRAFTAPTAALLDDLYRERGVRWLYADLRDGPVDQGGLDRLAMLRYRGTDAAVWQLRPPATR